MNLERNRLISWVIFLPTIGISILSLIGAIFPAFLLRGFGGFEDNIPINPLEPGAWAYPIIIGNCIVFFLFAIHLKNRLPLFIGKKIRYLFNFEVSPYVAFVAIVILVGLYTTFSIGELFDSKFDADYNNRVKPWLESFNLFELPGKSSDRDVGHHLQIFLEVESMKLFGNYKVIPFIASIALPIMTFFITAELTQKRFAGLVAMVIVLQSSVFLAYDTSVSYPNFWILFYLLSLYLIYKKWFLSAPVYVFAIFTKGLTAIFFPATLYFIFRSKISKRKKIYSILSYGIIIILGVSFFVITNTSLDPLDETGFSWHNFIGGFSAFSITFIDDGLILVFFIPLVVGLFVATRKGLIQAETILVLLFLMLVSAPFLSGFTDHQNVPYRFVPIVVFFAVGVGLLLSKTRALEVSSSKP